MQIQKKSEKGEERGLVCKTMTPLKLGGNREAAILFSAKRKAGKEEQERGDWPISPVDGLGENGDGRTGWRETRGELGSGYLAKKGKRKRNFPTPVAAERNCKRPRGCERPWWGIVVPAR